ncbi:MAG: hypothetical protein ABEJ57_05640 [Halobacteriaceae archaeon]
MEKLTLFELHFDGAQFGPTTMGGEDTASPAEPESEAGSSRRLGLVAASIIVAVVATAVAKRLTRDATVMEPDTAGEDISIDPVEAE